MRAKTPEQYGARYNWLSPKEVARRIGAKSPEHVRVLIREGAFGPDGVMDISRSKKPQYRISQKALDRFMRESTERVWGREPEGSLRVYDEWARIHFHEAVEDLRWAKGQAWSVTQWSVILLVAVLAGSHALVWFPAWPFLIVAPVIAIAAFVWLLDLNNFSRELCERARALQGGSDESYPSARATDPDHKFYLVVQVAVVLITSAVVWGELLISWR